MIVEFDPQYVQDLQNLRTSCKDEEEFKILIERIETEQQLIERNPISHTAPCDYEPLASEHYRKDKFHSRPKARGKADMRIIFQYIEAEDYLYFIAVGFRHTNRPHVYDRASERANARILLINQKPKTHKHIQED